MLAWWGNGEVLDPASSGPKAVSLAAMARSGLPVPPGFVVLADAPRDGDGRPSPELAKAIADAYRALGSPAVAVRSSATAEDLEGASFAGQYDTLLGVRGTRALCDAVATISRSLHSDRAVAYRRARAIPEDGLGMAVVVQQMVEADAAGVLFTRHPLTGADDVMMVSAARGLGEGVVDGTALVDTITLDAATGAVVLADLAGTTPVLADDALTALVVLGRNVRTVFGEHRDVEFAVRAGQLFALQARPITALDRDDEFPVRWASPGDARRSWSLRGNTVMQALEVDIQSALAERMRVGFGETGSPMMQAHIWQTFNGYLYVRQADGAPAELGRRQAAMSALHERYAARGTSVFEEEIEAVLIERLASLRRLRGRRRSLRGRVQLLADAIAVYADAMGNQHWRIQTQPIDWPATYATLTGRSPAEANVLLQAVNTRTSRLINSLQRLARIVQADPTLTLIFDERDWSALDAEPVAGSAADAFRAEFTRLLRTHGLRTGMGMGGTATFTSPTWNMAPSIPLGIIASYVRQDLDALVRRGRRLRAERSRLERAIRTTLASAPDRLARFELMRRRMVNDARTTEDHNHLMEQAAGGSMREAALLTGRLLTASGHLDDPDDVFDLSLGELDAIARSRPADASTRPEAVLRLVRDRQAVRRHQGALRPPRSLGAPVDVPARAGRDAMIPPSDAAGLDGDVLKGVSASRGRVTGKVRIAPPGHAPPDVRPGEILVARLVGEAWTPIFPILGGLVLDLGGILQHAAVVAREYGIPAVVMTREATRVLRDGQIVTVDGDAGVVQLSAG